jgi:hypothetical protein
MHFLHDEVKLNENILDQIINENNKFYNRK